jgi:16S rRNA (guanine527-N7)-methyltransferase
MLPAETPAPFAEALDRFAALVRASPHNLVSARARDELRERHIPECLAFAERLPRQGRFLDLGSGGGFPGIVVALHEPARSVHLLDATRKKTGFLRDAAATLGITVEVHTGRAEDLGRGELAGTFDVVTARAVAPLATLVAWSSPFLRPLGALYAIKGERWATEVAEAAEQIERHGLEVAATPSDDARFGPTSDHPQAPRVVMLRRAR